MLETINTIGLTVIGLFGLALLGIVMILYKDVPKRVKKWHMTIMIAFPVSIILFGTWLIIGYVVLGWS